MKQDSDCRMALTEHEILMQKKTGVSGLAEAHTLGAPGKSSCYPEGNSAVSHGLGSSKADTAPLCGFTVAVSPPPSPTDAPYLNLPDSRGTGA